MPRRPRLHVPGGYYHVTLRGNHGSPIFRRDLDRDLLDGIVAEAVERFSARVHAFCWMTNHLHFLLQIGHEPLSRLMHRIDGGYARAFQWPLETCGHLFERRYDTRLVDADSYLLEVIRYIHLNPVRANLVRDPAAYAWSSHRVYLGIRTAPWVTTDLALRMLHTDTSRARAAYRAFISAGQLGVWGAALPEANDTDPRVLGDDLFLSRVAQQPTILRLRMPLENLTRQCSERLGVDAGVLRMMGRRRDFAHARSVVAYVAATYAGISVQAVASYFNRDESVIRRGLERLRSDPARVKSSDELAASIMPICRTGTDQ